MSYILHLHGESDRKDRGRDGGADRGERGAPYDL